MIDKNIIEKNFSRYADIYEQHSPVQKRCVDELLAGSGSGRKERILELGCGTGRLTRELLKQNPGASIKAVDISERMIKIARDRSSGQNIQFLVSDAEKLELEEDFDLIVSNASFQWFDDLDAAMGRFRKMLSKNGTLCFSIYGPDTFKELRYTVNEYFGSRKNFPSSYFLSLKDLREIMNKYFEDFTVDEKSFINRYNTLMQLFREIKNSGTRGMGLGSGSFIGKKSVVDMEKIYIQKFGEIKATHSIFFCKARNN